MITHIKYLNKEQFMADLTAALLKPNSIFVPEIMGTGSTALEKLYSRVPSNNHLVTVDHIIRPDNWLADRNYKVDYTLSFDEIVELCETTKCKIFDPMNFNYDLPRQDDLQELAYESGYSHHPKAKQLELDRLYGKEMAKQIKLNVPNYQIYNVGDNVELDGRIVVKVVDDHYITTTSKEGLSVLDPTLTYCLEEFIEGEDLTYSFLVSGSNLAFIGTLTECNRLFPNGGGAKVGTAWASHDMSVECEPHVYEAMKKLVDLMAEKRTPLQGWIDVDLRKTVSGELYFIEFMVRNACSNFITHCHQLNVGYFDMIDHLAVHGVLPENTWRSPQSCSIELYSVTFDNVGYTPYTFKNPFNDGKLGCTFDPLSQYAYYHDDIFVSAGNCGSTQRIGVFSMLGNNELEYKEQFESLKDKIIHCAWRGRNL